MKSVSLFFVLIAAIGLIFPADAFACACCSTPNTYSDSTTKADAYKLEVLGEIKFDKAAFLNMTDFAFANIKGLGDMKKDEDLDQWDTPADFDLANSFAAKTWKFDLKTKTGTNGSLTLPMPLQMKQFYVDIHDSSDGGNGPSLYKEWRFKGNVTTGTGIFKSSVIKPSSYFLVLQGRGNNCDNASDFTHWRLEITNKKADYVFYGKLSSGVNQAETNAAR